MRKPFIAGNWKMFKTIAEAEAFAAEFKGLYKQGGNVRVAIFAPYLQLPALAQAFDGTDIAVGAENMHFADSGAYTGEISAPMLKEIGIFHCIIGHSERRQYFGETDETVNLKLKKAYAEGIEPVLCVGENLEERDGGQAFCVVKEQLARDLEGLTAEQAAALVIAYEPVWAIGTGRTATPEQAEEMCGFIRSTIAEIYGDDAASDVTIQYGGSVKPENIEEIMKMPDIDGALVGGASLNAADFIRIVNY